MKTVLSILVLSLSLSANAEIQDYSTLSNQRNNDVEAVAMNVENGVPGIIAFSKNGQMTLTKITANSDAIDIAEGEVYDINGQWIEGDVCNISGKLKLTNGGFEVDLSQSGTAFSANCSDRAALAGQYQ